jgi:hypothetical protein
LGHEVMRDVGEERVAVVDIEDPCLTNRTWVNEEAARAPRRCP